MTIEDFRWDVEDAITVARREMERADGSRAWAEGRSRSLSEMIRLPENELHPATQFGS